MVEQLEKRRQPYPSLDAIYFCDPSEASIQKIISDFSPKKSSKETGLYQSIHLFFTSQLDDTLFSRLKSSAANSKIKTLKELFVDYLPYESNVFTLAKKSALVPLYGTTVPTETISSFYRDISKKLSSFCISLSRFPLIRYSSSGSSEKVSSKIASLVYEELDNYSRLDPDFPGKASSKNSTDSRTTKEQCQLIILDRSVDPIAPLLHEFTYQAMVNDLLQLSDDGTRYKYLVDSKFHGATQKEVILDDETDNLWAEMRHSHIAECSQQIVHSFNTFLEKNQATTGLLAGKKNDVSSLNDLKSALSSMPQFQDLKNKYSIHMAMLQECLSVFSAQKLEEIASVEQELATGETVDGHTPKNIEVRLITLLDNPSVTLYAKVRLLMLYVIGKEGLRDDDRRRLLEHANIPAELTAAISNLSLLGVNISETDDKKKFGLRFPWKRKQRPQNTFGSDEVSYELSRYMPYFKQILKDCCENRLSNDAFPFIIDPKTPGSYGRPADVGSVSKEPGNFLNRKLSSLSGNSDHVRSTTYSTSTSLRTNKPNWHRKTASDMSSAAAFASERKIRSKSPAKSGESAPIIIFMAGGAAYSEIRSVYEIASKFSRTVFVGCTHLITPNNFIDELKILRLPFKNQDGLVNEVDGKNASSISSDSLEVKKNSSITGILRKLKIKH